MSHQKNDFDNPEFDTLKNDKKKGDNYGDDDDDDDNDDDDDDSEKDDESSGTNEGLLINVYESVIAENFTNIIILNMELE